MTVPRPQQQPPEQQSAPRPSPAEWVWRLAILAVLIVGVVWVARSMRARRHDEGSLFGTAAADLPPEFERVEGAPDEPRPPRRQVEGDARRLMAQALMAAAEEEGDYEHPGNQTPEDRRRFLADLLGVSQDNAVGAGPDVVPSGGRVVAAFQHPQNPGARIVIFRIPQTIDKAMAACHALYTAGGWDPQTPEPTQSDKAADRGWMMMYRQAGAQRILFAMPRGADEGETLVAVYDVRP